MRRKRTYIYCTLLLIALIRCRQVYAPPAITAPNRYLVVDGFVNAGANTVTTFDLNRTRNLGDTIVTGFPELNARMSIRSSSGVSYTLTDSANTGYYSSIPLTLDITQQYQISITTSDGQKFLSDPVPCKITPPIDSVYWRQPGDLTVFASTHDPSAQTHYYRYDYTETWEHDAQLPTPWAVSNGMLVAADSTNQTTMCWTTDTSTNILLANSANLSADIIDAAPVITVPQGDAKIDNKYSILVNQYALTADAYNYWQLIEKTSQRLGTLFDVQPTELIGNIHCTSNPSIPVIGFISAYTVQKQRLFIYETYLTNWQHNSPGHGCDTVEEAVDPLNNLVYNFPDTSYGPYYFNGPTILVLAPKFCLDCSRFGGTNVKPSWWPF